MDGQPTMEFEMSLSDIMKKTTSLARFQVSANAKKERDPILHQREKFTEAVNNQLDALEAEVCGKHYVKTVIRKHKETGEVVNKDIRFKKWYQNDGNRYLIVLRYGSRPLFQDGIIALTLDDVKHVLEGLIEAASAGHFDSEFQRFRRGTSEKTKSKNAGKTGNTGAKVSY